MTGFGLDQLGRPFFSFSFSSSAGGELDELDESQLFVSSYGRPIFFFHIVVSHRDFDKSTDGNEQRNETNGGNRACALLTPLAR